MRLGRRLGTRFRRHVSALAVFGALAGGVADAAGQGAARSGAATVSDGQALVDDFCVRCHNDRRLIAGLSLEGLDADAPSADPEAWEKVLRKLHARSMPPVGSPRPDEAGYAGLVASLEADLDSTAAARPQPGRPASFHRLNRTEYQNAVRDLLDLDVDVTGWLPGDGAAYGFDNNAAVLSMSPSLLDAYLTAATRVSRLAVGDMAAGADVASYRFSKALLQEDQVEGLPFGSRGGGAVQHYFPLDGEYDLTLDLAGPRNQSETIEIRIDGVKVGEVDPSARPSPLGDPLGTQVRITAPAGAHTLAVVFLKRMLAPEGRYPAYFPWANSAVFATTFGSQSYLHLDGVEITGPFEPTGVGDTASRRRIFSCQPATESGAEPCAAAILGRLARRAYRRPVTDADVEALVGFYRQARADGGDFDAGVRLALSRLLVDPDFLYRAELDPADDGVGPYRLGDLALASRLSFFLWSSLPDDELLTLADAGRLSEPDVLQAQVRRMLTDDRATSLVTNFAAQWLFLRNLQMVSPDRFQFPDWDDDLRLAMAQETELFLDHQRRGNRPLGELLTADYTFVNERLARHYGLDTVYGTRFRQVTLPDDRRAGLLGHASVLTVTSMPNRTSPVVRGKWLLENMLGTPPPAPPPDVPELEENERGEPARTIKERLEQHRRNPVCASCHATMDPLGFALEPFDAIGRWRSLDDGLPVDARGELIDGTRIEGPRGLREMLVARQDEFVRTVVEKLLTYAIGRGVEHYDMPAVRQILRETAADDHRWGSVILEIVKSAPFQMRERRGEQEGARVE